MSLVGVVLALSVIKNRGGWGEGSLAGGGYIQRRK